MSVSTRRRVRWSPARAFAIASLVWLVLTPADARIAQSDFSPSQATKNCSGKCLNPHPGQFTAADGQRKDKCWVQVWRTWPDGCTHWQWFDSCNKRWDADAAGRPRVTWTCCVH